VVLAKVRISLACAFRLPVTLILSILGILLNLK
jgi:hypothetical protein